MSPSNSNNNNVLDILHPYQLQWSGFSGESGGITNLQLDIVGFLAILGEGSVMASAQVATLSKMIYLPRLLPAPQALLRPNRPDKMHPVSGVATAVHSGNVRNYVNYVGHVLADAESLPEYSVKCVEIVRKHNTGEVKAKMFGPTHIVAVLGFALSLILFATSIWRQDGMAMMATVCLSLLSTLIGIGNKWTLNLPKRGQQNIWTPPGDVVIRYPKGNFLVVACNEDVARELYFAPEGLKYQVVRPWKYRMISLVGTIMLMFGVIFLGNASTYLQIAYAASYMVLNAAYWIVAALPQRYHWDMSCFEVRPQTFDETEKPIVAKEVHGKLLNGSPSVVEKPKRPDSLPKKRKPFVSYNETFTQALWKVILATKDIDWIVRSQAAPHTPAWTEWLHDALYQADSMDEPEFVIDPRCTEPVKVFKVPTDWNPQAHLGDCIGRHKIGKTSDLEKGGRKQSVAKPPIVLPAAPTTPGAV